MRTATGLRLIPCVLDLVGGSHHRLAVARGAHDRLDHAGEADASGRLFEFLQASREFEFRGGQSQLVGGELAKTLTIHAN